MFVYKASLVSLLLIVIRIKNQTLGLFENVLILVERSDLYVALDKSVWQMDKCNVFRVFKSSGFISSMVEMLHTFSLTRSSHIRRSSLTIFSSAEYPDRRVNRRLAPHASQNHNRSAVFIVVFHTSDGLKVSNISESATEKHKPHRHTVNYKRKSYLLSFCYG